MKTVEVENTTEATAVAEQGAHVGPEKKEGKKGASRKKDAPTGNQGAKKAHKDTAGEKRGKKPAKEPKADATKPAKEKRASKKAFEANKAAVPREFSKKAIVLDLLRRPTGATLAEIMKATDWQAHTVRGFISVVPKKQGIEINSSKNEAGERVYTLTK
jgi:hypothetical protein